MFINLSKILHPTLLHTKCKRALSLIYEMHMIFLPISSATVCLFANNLLCQIHSQFFLMQASPLSPGITSVLDDSAANNLYLNPEFSGSARAVCSVCSRRKVRTWRLGDEYFVHLPFM